MHSQVFKSKVNQFKHKLSLGHWPQRLMNQGLHNNIIFGTYLKIKESVICIKQQEKSFYFIFFYKKVQGNPKQ